MVLVEVSKVAASEHTLYKPQYMDMWHGYATKHPTMNINIGHQSVNIQKS